VSIIHKVVWGAGMHEQRHDSGPGPENVGSYQSTQRERERHLDCRLEGCRSVNLDGGDD